MEYGTCNKCGCTEDNACTHPVHGSCWWVDDSHELCSHCMIDEIRDDSSTEHPINKFSPGQKVRCIKEDPMDEYVGIPDENRWHIGDEFVIEIVGKYPWGIFLYDGEGNNLDARRAKII